MLSEKTTIGLQEAEERARSAVKTIRDTRRSAVRSYLGAAFELQRASLHALGVLNDEVEELGFTLLERAEKAEDRALKEAEARHRKNAERWRERNERWCKGSKRAKERFQEKKDKAEEARHRGEMRLRDGAKLGFTMMKVIGRRVDTMLGDFVEVRRREWEDMEGRIDGMLDRIENERQKSAEIPPFPNYNTMSVEEVVRELAALDAMQLRTVRGYEVRHQNRIDVLRAIDEMLAQRDEVQE